MQSRCLFCEIVAGRVPCDSVYADEEMLAFHDIQPAAPLHLLVVPKRHIKNLIEIPSEHHLLLGKMLGLASRLAGEHTSKEGFRVVINNGQVGGQEVYHLHMHVLGGSTPLDPAFTSLKS